MDVLMQSGAAGEIGQVVSRTPVAEMEVEADHPEGGVGTASELRVLADEREPAYRLG